MSSWRNQPLQQQQQRPSHPLSQPVQQQQQAAPPENGPRAKCDQVVFEAIAKAAEIVVGSRCWIDNLPMANNSSSSRFNLMVPEVQGVRSILQRWKRALHVPLRLDVYYQHPDSRRELLERWCLEYAPKPSNGGGAGAGAGGGILPNPFAKGNPLSFASTDPIVQLRQVCKQIVIWLRSLYCLSRMLPAQALRPQRRSSSNGPYSRTRYSTSNQSNNSSNANNNNNNNIGFSIYVVSEGNDDVSGLVSNQGFQSQGQPHSVMTPYGELGWRVFYAPKAIVERLIPESPAYHRGNLSSNAAGATTSTASQPIPMQNQQLHHNNISHQTQQPNTQQNKQQTATSFHPQHHLLQRRDSTPPSTTAATARSAPHGRNMMYPRSHSDIGDDTHAHALRMQQQEQEQNRLQLGGGRGGNIAILSTSADSKPPTKTLSALSLALMQSDENLEQQKKGEEQQQQQQPQQPKQDTSTEQTNQEKRRAALHHAPPTLAATPTPPTPVVGSLNAATSPVPMMPIPSPVVRKTSLTSAGEYGYAYNSHIPTLRSNTAVPNSGGNNNSYSKSNGMMMGTTPDESRASTPTTPLASTPPGYLYGGASPATFMHPSAMANLIPPRSLSSAGGAGGVGAGGMGGGTVTPPFVRPLGFVGEPTSQLLPPTATTASAATAAGGGNASSATSAATAKMDSHQDQQQKQHLTSLDLLHSSPFQQPPPHGSAGTAPVPPGGGEGDGAVAAGGTNVPNSNMMMMPNMPSHISDFHSASAAGGNHQHQQHHLDPRLLLSHLTSADYHHLYGANGNHYYSSHQLYDNPFYPDDADDMPFAVDSTTATTNTPTANVPSAGGGATTTTNPTSLLSTALSGAGAAGDNNNTTSTLAPSVVAAAASSFMTPAPKRLALFDSVQSSMVANMSVATMNSATAGTTAAGSYNSTTNNADGTNADDEHPFAMEDVIASQLEEFKNFSLTLDPSNTATTPSYTPTSYEQQQMQQQQQRASPYMANDSEGIASTTNQNSTTTPSTKTPISLRT